VLVLIALVLCAQWAVAQEHGNVCVQSYTPGANCTANDVRITEMSPTLDEVCLVAGDPVTAVFTVRLVTGATNRYDIGLFVAEDGGSALNGESCYHDFLQPPVQDPNWTTTYRDTDGDACADTRQTDPDVYYTLQEELQITCVDTDGDGVVDPISTCTSWDNNANTTCSDVTGAIPGTGSKCNCVDVAASPPILVYRGYDWGDLPDTYGTTDGPQHAVHQDTTGTGTDTPQTQGGIPAVWLGMRIDTVESGGLPGSAANGDDTDGDPNNDEDGVDLQGSWSVADGGEFSVTVNSSDGTCAGCRLGFWIDWNQDGVFGVEGSGEQYEQADIVYGTQTVSFTISESDWPDSPEIYARFRLYDGNYTGAIAPTGMVRNGEVEDYYFNIGPTAVELVSFEATGLKKAVLLTWETASEVDNLGFNLYRATSLDGPRTRINDELIPAAIFPGRYEYLDTRLPRRIYYYWLEDLDIYGRTTLHGPVSARTTAKRTTNKGITAR
jgi:hypothetical protein